MTQKVYIVEGRQFRTQVDYKRAMRDKELIDSLRSGMQTADSRQLEQLRKDIKAGTYKFHTLLGEDFADEVDEKLAQAARRENRNIVKKKENSNSVKQVKGTKNSRKTVDATRMDIPEEAVKQELLRQEKRRRKMILLCSIAAVCCIGYFAGYTYYEQRTGNTYEQMSQLKEQPLIAANTDIQPQIHYTTQDAEPREVLDEYKNLLNKNKKLIGWVKIDDTNIDYPVMQTSDNEYYLTHNLDQEYDKNGSIFMDKDCDAMKPSTNLILYGHHMKSGNMFGKLDLYSEQSYYEEHPYIQFDTIYEKGQYQVMYVFRSRVYSETEIVFKYYQFIDALSEQEFNSYMNEMAEMSLYDTGVTAQYGDQLLTLSTCDYQEKNGRFVVVAKKVETKEIR